MSKEYNVLEVIKRIVEYPNEEYIDVISGVSIKNQNDVISFYKNGEKIRIWGIDLNYKLQRICRSVPIKEALDEYRFNRKTIESVLDEKIRTYKYNPLEMINQDNRGVSASEIVDGKWYINE